jgi:hypothetical protein
MRKRILVVFVGALSLLAVIAAEAPAQSRPNLQIIRLTYNIYKAQANPEGELKAALDALKKELAEATKAGQTGEVRRLYAKGIALLQKREWTDAADFAGSLVLRAEEICVDSSRPFTLRLEQDLIPQNWSS